MRIKTIPAFFCLTSILLLSGCWSSTELNTMGISVCIGIDKSENGFLISEQIINPKAVASKRATDESPVVLYTGEGENIQEVIARMSMISSRKIYHAHLRMVIISEEVARDGIYDIVDFFLRNREFHTDFYFAIAKGITARELMDTLTPVEAIPGVDMFNKLTLSHKLWAPTKATRIPELANNLAAEGIAPAINAVELAGGGSEPISTEVLNQSSGYDKIKFTDIGAFQADKLVGWLNESEAKGYNYIIGNVKRTFGFSTDEGGNEVTAEVIKATSRIRASVINNQPQIEVEIKIRYVINQIKGDLDVTKIENLEAINRISESKIMDNCNKSVQKAQELKTDIFGFGERFHAKDPAYWKTVKDNWNEVFTTLPVHINVKAELVTTGDLTKTIRQNG